MTMEHKIGEIFEYKDEWYQCIKQPEDFIGEVCKICAFQGTENCDIDECSDSFRSDKQDVIFKKLEKVGEPYRRWLSPLNIMVQRYGLYGRNVIMPDEPYMYFNAINNTIEIEIKQNKEDMEEKKIQHYDCFFDKEQSKPNLKPFSLEAVKAGKPVCTRDGRKARIICFDVKGDICPIIALIEKDNTEVTYRYNENGQNAYNKSKLDLMMLPEKKEGWVNIYYEHDAPSHREASWVYDKEEEAIKVGKEHGSCYIATVRIEWEE